MSDRVIVVGGGISGVAAAYELARNGVSVTLLERDELAGMARAMGLLPEADGYLADGTPMFSLESFAEKMGVPLDEAEARLQAFLADRAAMGLSNDGIVTDARLVHRKQ